KTSETLTFTEEIADGSCTQIFLQNGKWAWRRPLMGQKPYLRNYSTDFNETWFVIVSLHPNDML
ncbi:hypothetical protein PN49_17670, partial [Vibrio anguillarum]